MYSLIRQLLFLLPPEVAHAMALKSLVLRSAFLPASKYTPPQFNSRQVMGLQFQNPVGLAAGLDKNGDYIDALGSLGFGFVEVGTVTPRPQPGNPKPRLFRLPKVEAIINRMGFNNKGVDYLIEQVKKRRYQGVLGINIGKNFDTPVEKAVEDYVYCLQKVYPEADYITVNISSPNTPGLRELQHGELLKSLINSLKSEQFVLREEYGRIVPIAFKIAPDLDADEVQEMATIFNETKIDALIATNTTSLRNSVAGLPHAEEQGGLSGKPVFKSSTEMLSTFRQLLDPEIPIIGVGGVSSADDVTVKFTSGAELVQLYTSLIYQGPNIVKTLVKSIQ